MLPADPNPDLQVAARVLGHMTTLTVSLLAFPVARNGLWDAAFGIPFERAVRYHRGLGWLTWASVTAHMLAWWLKWGMEGTLGHNLASVAYLRISPAWHHPDNFTIALTHLAWMGVTVMVALALRRRANYRLFYLAHHFAIFFLVVAVIHAWTHWYYACGGLVLWFYDRLVRIVKRSRDPIQHNSIMP